MKTRDLDSETKAMWRRYLACLGLNVLLVAAALIVVVVSLVFIIQSGFVHLNLEQGIYLLKLLLLAVLLMGSSLVFGRFVRQYGERFGSHLAKAKLSDRYTKVRECPEDCSTDDPACERVLYNESRTMRALILRRNDIFEIVYEHQADAAFCKPDGADPGTGDPVWITDSGRSFVDTLDRAEIIARETFKDAGQCPY